MPSGRSGTAATRARMSCSPPAIAARIELCQATRPGLGGFPRDLHRGLSFSRRSGGRDRGRDRRSMRCGAAPLWPASSSAASRTRAPGCTRRRWPRSAALVPDDAAATLPGRVPGRGDEFTSIVARAGLRRAVLAGRCRSARAEGTFEIPAGAHFNPEKLAKVSEFFRNEVATGKIPGANVLIQQHGKPVYHEVLRRAGRRVQGADHRQDDLPPVLDDQGDHFASSR